MATPTEVSLQGRVVSRPVVHDIVRTWPHTYTAYESACGRNLGMDVLLVEDVDTTCKRCLKVRETSGS